MRCSSILLKRHENLCDSSAFVVIDFVCLLFINLCVDVLRFLFWFLGDLCLWFWCWAFFIFLSVDCG